MTNVKFQATFRGGAFGFVEIKLHRNGILYGYPISISGSGSKKVTLEAGLYLISVKGVAPPNGATFRIDQETNPATPDNFSEGPIFGSYVLNLNENQ